MKFYDTNALLLLQNKVLEENFAISITTLRELENIKTSRNKDDDVKYKARKILHILDENPDSYEVFFGGKEYLERNNMEISPDNEICACASIAKREYPDLIFVTNDIACKMIAKHLFDLDVDSTYESTTDNYTGFLEVSLSEEEMADFYANITENRYELLPNQYLVIRDKNGTVVDKLRWDGEMYQNIKFPTIKSNLFGTVKPYNADIYQQMALNSLSVNTVTMIKGSAGTGKSYLALGYMLWLLEKHKIDKIIIFANPTATANSAKLGFLPGSQLEKLIDSSIGNMLAGKLGDKYMIEQLVSKNQLSILPMCDIRGFDTSGSNCAVYITEAQNLDISLMKLALQRIGENSICIIDGDYYTQVDSSLYAGNNNGMRRMSEVFRGQDFYGEVELQNIYRSKIALIADKM